MVTFCGYKTAHLFQLIAPRLDPLYPMTSSFRERETGPMELSSCDGSLGASGGVWGRRKIFESSKIKKGLTVMFFLLLQLLLFYFFTIKIMIIIITLLQQWLLLLSYTAVPGSARPCWGGSFEKKKKQPLARRNKWLMAYRAVFDLQKQ